LTPFWAKDLKITYKTIKALAETVATAPVFREAPREVTIKGRPTVAE
jgi:putative SOS response-associated peptidase YedK